MSNNGKLLFDKSEIYDSMKAFATEIYCTRPSELSSIKAEMSIPDDCFYSTEKELKKRLLKKFEIFIEHSAVFWTAEE